MPRCQLIAELATNHGGDVQLAKDMISAAAEAGADIVKTQGYQITHLKPTDPQYDWMRQCELSEADHVRLKVHAEACGVQYLSTAYHVEDLALLRRVGLTAVKLGSGEGMRLVRAALDASFSRVYVSLPWGRADAEYMPPGPDVTVFATVPLYPMPPECYARCHRQSAWSDHAIGLTVAKIAIASGVRYVEKHFHLVGKGCREQPWNMAPEDVQELALWARECVQAMSGTKYEGRWCA